MRPIKAFLEKSFTREGILVYGSNTAWMLAERGLRILIGLTVGVLLARELGPGRYGFLSYAIGFLTILTPVSTMCIDAVVVRDLIQFPENRDAILGTAFIIRIGSSLFTCLLLGIIVPQIHATKDVHWMILIIGSSFLFMPFQVIDDHFQSLLQVRISVIIQMTAAIVVAGLNIINIREHLSILCFAFAEACNWAIMGSGWLVGIFIVGHTMKQWRFSGDIAKTLLRSAWPLLALGTTYMIYTRSDFFIIKYFLGSQFLGWYSVPVRLSETCFFLPQIIANAVYPALVKTKSISHEAYQRRIGQLYFFLFWISVSVAIVGLLLGKPFIQWFYGHQFAPSSHLIKIYIWGIVSVAIQSVFNKWCITDSHFNLCLGAHIMALTINISINWIFIKSFGLTASALASVLSLPIAIFITLQLSSQGRSHWALLAKSLWRFQHGTA
jgi:PST family polysaccharide transporter